MLAKRGPITGRPWGCVLAEIAHEQLTGELVVLADGKRHAIAFDAGMVVGAVSPAIADSIGRLALTSGFVSSTQVGEIVKRIAAAPGRDELELLAEVTHLSEAQITTLARKTVTQRAARTFAIEEGTFEFDDKLSVPAPRGEAIDVRAVIYLGARMHVAETRLANELRDLGTRFVLRIDSDTSSFGFTTLEQPILDALRGGSSVAEVEATHRELDPRVIAAAIYTLATAGACAASLVARTKTPVVSRTMTPPMVSRSVTPMASMTPQPAIPRTMTPQPAIPRTMTPPALPRTFTPPVISRTVTPPAVSRTMTPKPPLAVGSSTAMPAVSRTQTSEPAISRTATGHPDFQRTPTKDRTPEWLEARDAFQRGEMAMRREQIAQAIGEFARAVELQPENADYVATLAWTKFCGAIDKASVADETRKTLDKAIRSSSEAITPWLCLGRVERMLGHDKEALKNFQQVLVLQPHNTTAASEVRVLEARLRR